jgi:hypothetical protein
LRLHEQEAGGGPTFFLDTASSLFCTTFCTIPKFPHQLVSIEPVFFVITPLLFQLAYCRYKLFFFLLRVSGNACSTAFMGLNERFERNGLSATMYSVVFKRKKMEAVDDMQAEFRGRTSSDVGGLLNKNVG